MPVACPLQSLERLDAEEVEVELQDRRGEAAQREARFRQLGRLGREHRAVFVEDVELARELKDVLAQPGRGGERGTREVRGFCIIPGAIPTTTLCTLHLPQSPPLVLVLLLFRGVVADSFGSKRTDFKSLSGWSQKLFASLLHLFPLLLLYVLLLLILVQWQCWWGRCCRCWLRLPLRGPVICIDFITPVCVLAHSITG